MNLQFVKMSGAGNDFIVLDNMDGSLDTVLTPEFIRSLCERGVSVGADGLLEMRSDADLPFRMKYYNSDGMPADMCGNGGRCIASFAAARGIVSRGALFRFRSDAGVHIARVDGESAARIWMTGPVVHFLDMPLMVGGSELRVSFLDTGVPHAVVLSDGPDTPPFQFTAPLLRRHPAFGEAGANADYLWREHGSMFMRTWERGVEGETLACGTGAVACAICAVEILGAGFPVRVTARSGRTLTTGMDGEGWWLQGEAREVYAGVLKAGPPGSLTEGR